MNILNKLFLILMLNMFLSGCVNSKRVDNDMIQSVDRAERLRDKVLWSKPQNGQWDNREFKNRVSGGGDTEDGSYGSFDLTGEGSGHIPNDASRPSRKE